MSDLLPPNATPQERALSEAIERAGTVTVPVQQVWSPQNCPPAILPWLAWAFSVDEWDTNWTDTQKRDVIAKSIAVHKTKGTIGAVKTALLALGYDVQVQEWFNQVPEGAPYTFKLLVDSTNVGVDMAGYEKIVDVVSGAKNLRSHLDEIVPSMSTKAGPYLAAVSLLGSEIIVEYQPLPLIVNSNALIG